MTESDNSETIQQIRQKKLNCLAAKRLHKRRRQGLNRLNLLVDVFALLTPIIALPVRYIVKGGSYASIADTTWEIMAGILLAVTFFKLVCHWQENAQEHSKLMGENISLVGLADGLLADTSKLSADLPAFRLLLQQSETDDSNLLGEPSDSDRQWAYREALKEFGGPDIKCPIPKCQRSPWQYKTKWWMFGLPDDKKCQACGNTG